MYKLKENPEDFIVNEVTNIKTKDSGRFFYYWMTKKNYNGHDALKIIADRLNVRSKFIGFAGTKDRAAITKQLISITSTTKQKIDALNLKDIKLDFFGLGDIPISLGDLKGNEFIITIRNLERQPNLEKNKFINYFGKQRFSKNNSDVGKAILQKKFKKAIELILEKDGNYEKNMRYFLQTNSKNNIGALRLVPRKILKMFVHAYQSKLWNDTASFCVENKIKIKQIPIVGFGTEFENEEIESFLQEKLKYDNLTQRDFIVQSIPELTSEGNDRDLFIDTEIKLLEKTDDMIKIEFFLQKGAYATEVIRQLLV